MINDESSLRKPSRLHQYNRENALNYALKWGLKRNPRYLDYSKLGGDCTSFISQIIHSGGGIMNYNSSKGWYYINGNRKSASWTGVNYLYRFLVNNKSVGPFARQVDVKDVMIGDIIQLSFDGGGVFDHSLAVTRIDSPIDLSNIYITTHTRDFVNRKLTEYEWEQIRFLHIAGVNA